MPNFKQHESVCTPYNVHHNLNTAEKRQAEVHWSHSERRNKGNGRNRKTGEKRERKKEKGYGQKETNKQTVKA
jgi:hypothetical protein